MKFSLKVGDLLNAVENVSYTIDKKAADGTGGILMAARKTDTQQAVLLYTMTPKAETVTKIDGTVSEAGQILVDPVQLRAGLMYRNPEEIAEISRVEEKDQPVKIRLKIGKSKIHVGVNSTGLETMQKRMNAIPFRQEEAYTLKGKDLAEFVRRASFCIPDENEGTNRYELTGMKMLISDTGYEAQATDGHVMGRIVIKGEVGPKKMDGVLIPALALPALARLVKKEDEVKVIEGEKNDQGVPAQLFFKIGANTFFGTRLLSGRFPVITTVLDMHKPDFWFTVDRIALKQELDRLPAFDDTRRVTLGLRGDSLRVFARGKGEIDGEIPVEREEGVPDNLDLKIVIDVPYIRNAATGSTQERLRLGISDNTKKEKQARALIVDDTAENVEAKYAMMPVRQ